MNSKYENKPFKSPLITGRPVSNGSGSSIIGKSGNLAPTRSLPAKAQIKRAGHDNIAPLSSKKGTFAIAYYATTYRKFTRKKHKTWEGDGKALEMNNGSYRFYKDDGRFMGSTSLGEREERFEKIFTCSGFEIQLDHQIEDETTIQDLKNLLTKIVEPSSNAEKPALHKNKSIASSRSVSPRILPLQSTSSQSFKPAFKPSSIISNGVPKSSKEDTFLPLFDPSTIENPLIMNSFAEADTDVVVDPILSKHLRPHQRIGVKFMYDCILGLSRPSCYEDDGTISTKLKRTNEIQGCLLADEMGLGKTLMTITLIWTLLKQTPIPSKANSSQNGISLQGLCNKILVVCPVTLIGNWKREFSKWLNVNRIGILTLSSKSNAEKDKLTVRNFLRVQRTYQVLVIGYEKLLSVTEELLEAKSKIDLVICDEGHRLKNGQSKTLKAISSLEVPRKIMLTGTPIQNDLAEFFTIADFLNDGILGTFSKFKRDFINPITRARDLNNKHNNLIQEKGRDKTQELIEITKNFTLRRTAETISKFLPSKTDVILFCKPTSGQLDAFRKTLSAAQLDFSRLTFNSSLGLITLFKKICNSPSLISQDSYYLETIKPNSGVKISAPDSGKLRVLMALLDNLRKSSPQEKVVIVSNYTQTLDIIQNMICSNSLSFTRLDGSTANKDRDKIVNSFNTVPSIFAFLLSAKSGGMGLNLIGASRLILFDNDWNPAIDLQAMSRIHRDGQKRECYIYRLLTTGCIDEKIFQRQLAKTSLSSKFMGDSADSNTESGDDLFGSEDLKDLFTVHATTSSNTHDLICSCQGLGQPAIDDACESSHTGEAAEVAEVSYGWTNAKNLKETIERASQESDARKAALVQQCLVGYDHVLPCENHSPLMDAALIPKSDISFAFIKEVRH